MFPLLMNGRRLKKARSFWREGKLTTDDFVGCEVGPGFPLLGARSGLQ
jgi:hypothetical protein